MNNPPLRYRTPPQYAKDIGVDPAKVIAWIKRGELRAMNVATNTNGRPRFRISLEAIVEFEERRSARQPVKPVRRKRKKQESGFVEYF
jgi:hypothetical protein